MRGRETTREWEVSLKRDRTGNYERIEDMEEGGDRNRERIQERDGARIPEENDIGIGKGDETANKNRKHKRIRDCEKILERNLSRFRGIEISRAKGRRRVKGGETVRDYDREEERVREK